MFTYDLLPSNRQLQSWIHTGVGASTDNTRMNSKHYRDRTKTELKVS